MSMPRIPSARELIEFAAVMGEKLFDKDGVVEPLWHVVCSDGKHGVLATPMLDGAHKDAVSAGVRAALERLDAVAVLFMCESWMLMGGPGLDVRAVRRDGIKDDPRRVECVWYSAEDAAGTLTAVQMIERGGGTARLAPLKWLDKCDRMEGRFVGMLPTKELTKH